MLMSPVMSARATHVMSCWLAEVRVSVSLPEPGCALSRKMEASCGLGLEGIFDTFDCRVYFSYQMWLLSLEGVLEGCLCWT